MRVEQRFVTLENYISLLQNQDEQDQITIKHLNQILEMHGFYKIYKQQKVLVDAVNSIEVLLNPFRSTISEKISPASLTKEEIVNALSILDWKDCAVQRIESVVVNTTSASECLAKSPSENHGMDKSFTPEVKKKRSYTKKKDKKEKGQSESGFSTPEKEHERRYRKKENKEKGSLESWFAASWGSKKTRYNSNEPPTDFSSIPLLESLVAKDPVNFED
ncbi:uncharacterized protein LOC113360376 [Papaver somniferum]|uniref:uncharacterized protein LOC113360376 n=1 Tax=Papaver somniferum TaxID=3469 RepID=UPI000E705703|nr:uncharacterized protein LOC113360376 [Papaver somniferum]